jgi:hypothetical protein
MKFEDIERANTLKDRIERHQEDLVLLANSDGQEFNVNDGAGEKYFFFRIDVETLRQLIRDRISDHWGELVALGIDDPRKDDEPEKAA